MPKKIEDVILPERRKSIRNIPIPESRRKMDKLIRPENPKKPVPLNIPRHHRSSKKKIWISAGVATTVLVVAILSMFSGATLSYTPKSALLSFSNEVYGAVKAGNTGLFYSVVKLSRDKGQSVPASGESQVSRKASGVIVVYNNASTEPQKLVENTRFESADGKIYRIQKAISIPGKKTLNGVTQPGSLEVIVYADQPGEAYNAGLSDFTVPGLKGTPRFTTIYARSKTPMTGGFIGLEKAVKAEDLSRIKGELQTVLQGELWEEAQAEVPEDFILFPSLSLFVYEDLPQSDVSGTGSNVTVNTRGHLYGVMFKKSDLSTFLAQKKIALSKDELLDIPNFASLTLSFVGIPPADLLLLNEISFKVSGSATAVWRTDEVALRADLLGRHERDVVTILKNYPTVAKSSVRVRPVWKSTLPDEADKILIKKLSVE